jgi:hypothetical protein
MPRGGASEVLMMRTNGPANAQVRAQAVAEF